MGLSWPVGVAVAAVGVLWSATTGALAQNVFRTNTDLVNLGVTVMDKKGALVPGLTAGDFEVVEDGKLQTVTFFASGDAAAEGLDMHLGLLIDVSESMGENLGFTKTAAVKFVNTLTDAVDVTVVDFDTEVRVARYGRRELPRLVERIRGQKAGGDTALYDAIGLYLDDASAQSGRKIMLLYTDGGDTRSSLRYGELIDLLKASDVTVYAIGQLDRQAQSLRMEQRMVLQQIADATGGQAFFPGSVKELDDAYAKVLAQIHAQYTLAYQSTNPRTDGAWRKVDVRVVRSKDYRLRARKGYFALYKKP